MIYSYSKFKVRENERKWEREKRHFSYSRISLQKLTVASICQPEPGAWNPTWVFHFGEKNALELSFAASQLCFQEVRQKTEQPAFIYSLLLLFCQYIFQRSKNKYATFLWCHWYIVVHLDFHICDSHRLSHLEIRRKYTCLHWTCADCSAWLYSLKKIQHSKYKPPSD